MTMHSITILIQYEHDHVNAVVQIELSIPEIPIIMIDIQLQNITHI